MLFVIALASISGIVPKTLSLLDMSWLTTDTLDSCARRCCGILYRVYAPSYNVRNMRKPYCHLGLASLALVVIAVLLAGCGGGGSTLSPGPGATFKASDVGKIADYAEASAVDVTNDGIVVGCASSSSTDLSGWIRGTDGKISLIETPEVQILAVNESGKAIGADGSKAYIIDLSTGQTRSLDRPRNARCEASDINDDGIVVGGCDLRPYSWNSSGSATGLLLPDGYSGGKGLSINNGGSVAGYLRRLDGWDEAVVWNTDGTINHNIAAGIDYKGTQAVLINDAGYIAIRCFQAKTAGQLFNAAMLRKPTGILVTLGKLGYPGALTTDMNSTGQVVGALCSDVNLQYPQRAVIWSPDGFATQLPMPTGCVKSWATGINDYGKVVGAAMDSRGLEHAITWTLSQ